VPNAEFFEITEEVGAAFQSGFDGLVGLSFPELSNENGLFDFMISAGVVQEKIFSFYMDRKGEQAESRLSFGGYDESLKTGDINWHYVTEPLFWTIDSTKMLIGD